jgi:CDP-ribitol ribitolphosphotransferase
VSAGQNASANRTAYTAAIERQEGTAGFASVAADRAAPAEELLSVEFRRVQVIVRLASHGQPPLDPRSLRLISPHEPPAPPTRASRVGTVVCARFNVIQGHAQMPLASGRWTLAVAAESGETRALELRWPPGLSLETGSRQFRDDTSGYVATLTREGSRLCLDVALDPPSEIDARDIDPASVGRRWFSPAGLRVLVRRKLFDWGVPLLRALPGSRRNIVFVSELSTTLVGNLAAIKARMVERELDRAFHLHEIHRPAPTASWGIAEVMRAVWRFARAKAIVTDGHIRMVQAVSWRVPTIQVWHAYGAFKQMNYSLSGRPSGPNPFSRALKGYAAVAVGSEAEIPVYAEAFGLPEERIHPTGIPRLDAFFDPAKRAAAAEAARALLPESRGRRVILLAPTYRGAVQDADYDVSVLDFEAINQLCLDLNAIFVIRLHPFVQRALEIPASFRDRVIDGRRVGLDTNDLLLIVDILVTDYSSVIYEFSTLERPMLFFAFDLESYQAERDFYEDYATFVPGKIVRSCDELIDAIRREDFELDKVRPFAVRRVGGKDGGSTDRVVDLITLGVAPARGAGDPFCVSAASD